MRTESFVYRTRIPASADDVYEWHLRSGAFERLVPAWERIRLLDPGNGVADGSRVELELSNGPFRQRWTAEHRDIVSGKQFRDIQVRGPFAKWEHTHSFIADGTNACWLEDRVEFAPPFGALGRLAVPSVRKKLRATFAYRHRTTAADLFCHRQSERTHLMKILVTGSHGLIGSALVPFLTTGGHSVTRLVRRETARPCAESTVRWDPILGTIDQQGFEGHDAVVHLAGENISGGRWNERQKKAIRESRLHGTRMICDALLKLRQPPKALVCASAIGIYGDRGDEILDENRPRGVDFRPRSAAIGRQRPNRCGSAGSASSTCGLGSSCRRPAGRLPECFRHSSWGQRRDGNGKQFWSWVGIDDVVGAIHHALNSEHLNGPVNAVSPHPATNRDFTETLGKVLGRPTVFPMPAFAARLALGQMADDLLFVERTRRPAARRNGLCLSVFWT